jgi:hypothetical protein
VAEPAGLKSAAYGKIYRNQLIPNGFTRIHLNANGLSDLLGG